MDTLNYKTRSLRKEDVERDWYIVDASAAPLGRLCTQIAHVLRGKHRPDYTPHVDCGAHVVVINAGQLRLTGNKLDHKEYLRYSGYPGGQKSTKAKELIDKRPEFIVENAVRGMLPKSKLGRAMFRKLHVYKGADHPHQAQKPQPLNV